MQPLLDLPSTIVLALIVIFTACIVGTIAYELAQRKMLSALIRHHRATLDETRLLPSPDQKQLPAPSEKGDPQ